MKVEIMRIFLLPKTSDNEAAGKLMSMPGMVEAAAIMPVRSAGVPRLMANGFKTGSLDMVELKIANAPITHRIKKYLSIPFLTLASCISPLLRNIRASAILFFLSNPPDAGFLRENGQQVNWCAYDCSFVSC